ncbi:hypothetical protein H6P81_001607 [Aristolochia fimbriata]|uniref:Uncharacterized protein n=1 Tax=Aristolochia fimbriata TaxID=158543 RepID=A0AAV7F8V6_ARIFI|nr:hypothetical protein H6P81_001607 [Aristolochia fimbriata]
MKKNDATTPSTAALRSPPAPTTAIPPTTSPKLQQKRKRKRKEGKETSCKKKKIEVREDVKDRGEAQRKNHQNQKVNSGVQDRIEGSDGEISVNSGLSPPNRTPPTRATSIAGNIIAKKIKETKGEIEGSDGEISVNSELSPPNRTPPTRATSIAGNIIAKKIKETKGEIEGSDGEISVNSELSPPNRTPPTRATSIAGNIVAKEKKLSRRLIKDTEKTAPHRHSKEEAMANSKLQKTGASVRINFVWADIYGPNQHRTIRVNKSKTDPSQINEIKPSIKLQQKSTAKISIATSARNYIGDMSSKVATSATNKDHHNDPCLGQRQLHFSKGDGTLEAGRSKL